MVIQKEHDVPLIILAVIVIGLTVAAFWRIFKRIGWPVELSLVCLVPISIPIVIGALALARWPIEDEMERLRRMRGG